MQPTQAATDSSEVQFAKELVSFAAAGVVEWSVITTTTSALPKPAAGPPP